MEVAGDTAARCDSGEADGSEGVTGEGSTRRALADRAVDEMVGVEIGGRAEATGPWPNPEPEAGAGAEPVVERDGAAEEE